MRALAARIAVAVAIVLSLGLAVGYAQDAGEPSSPTSGQAPGRAGRTEGQPEPEAPAPGQDTPGGHQHDANPAPPPADIPPITDADRAAAFPVLNGGHAVHDEAVHYYVLFDRLEWQGGGGAATGSWDSQGWIGRDVERFWFRTEGEVGEGGVDKAHVHALFGRAIHPWWDVVAGVRQDLRPGPARTWAAVGIQGLAPYWFEVEATAYIGASARTHVRVRTEYELLLTNRLILQPLVEFDIHGKSDPERGIARGLSTGAAGFRVRFEIRRELAPYVGVTWSRMFLGTADLARAAGEDIVRTRIAAGLRMWF